MNRLAFTPAAPVPTTHTHTSHALSSTTSAGRKEEKRSSVVPASAPSGPSPQKKWQQVLGGGRASPMGGANALKAMSTIESASGSTSKPATVPAPSVRPVEEESYFPSTSTQSQAGGISTSPAKAAPIPIPGKGDPTTSVSTPVPPPPAPTPPSPELEPNDGLVNVPIQWSGSGKTVFVAGNFADNWKGRIKLTKSTHDFNTILRLPPGQYRLKFIVDDSWRCSKQISTATDDDGTLVNWIEVEAPKTAEEMKAEWAMDARPAAKQEEADESQWTTAIPMPLVLYQYIEELRPLLKPSAFDTLVAHHHLSNVPQPPMLPRILDRVIVNADPTQALSGPSTAHPPLVDDNSILAVPNHTVLNHLTASAIKNGTLGVGTTTRYRKKVSWICLQMGSRSQYITTMFFKPAGTDVADQPPVAAS